MKHIKVIYLITGVNVGGAEKLVLDTVRNLDTKQFEPVVVSLVGGELLAEFQGSGIRIYDLGMTRRWPFAGMWRLWRVLKKEKPKILHTHLIHADFLGRVLGWLCGIPIIITTLHMVEDARRRFPYHSLDRFAARFNTALIAVSEIVKKDIVNLEKLDSNKITVIRNAVADLYPVNPRRAQALRKQLNVKPGDILVGVVSRLEIPRKGHHVLIKALAQLVLQHPHLHCAVIGDGLGREELQLQVEQLGLNAHVTFVGTQHNIPEWLQALDIFVLPSLHEGFPMAIIEAMAAGRPIVATRVGGVGELIEHRREGLLIKPDDVSDLVEAINGLILDSELRACLGKSARQRFQQHFEISRVIEATQRIYWKHLKELGISGRVHLLEVVTNLDPGGVPRHIEDLTRNLSPEHFEIEMVSGEKYPQRIQGLGFPHHYVDLIKPIHPFQDLIAIWQMFWLFRNLKPDIVHSHKSKAGCMASIAARIAGVPSVISTIHGVTKLTRGFSIKQFFYDAVELISLRFFAHGTISVSEATAQHLVKWGKVLPAHNATIYNGIDSHTLNVDRAAVYRRLNLQEYQPIVLMTGRLAKGKRPEILIQACSLLRQQFPDLVCLLAGDGQRFQEMRSLVQHYQLEGTVHLLGHRDDVPDLLRVADIFVLCSWQEGLSIAILEAMAAGLPVIASRVPGMDEVVSHGQTGYLVEGGSPEECAVALQSLLLNPEMRRSMGQAGYQKFQQQFSLSQQLAKTQALLLACSQGGFPKNYVFPKDLGLPHNSLEPMRSLEKV